MSSPSKRKGDRGEREVAELLKRVFPDARRRVNGEERQDDLPGRDIQGVFPLCVQVNLSAEPRIAPKLKEALHAAEQDETPVAFTRKASKDTIKAPEPWIASMLAEDFIDLVRRTRGTTTRSAAAAGLVDREACLAIIRQEIAGWQLAAKSVAGASAKSEIDTLTTVLDKIAKLNREIPEAISPSPTQAE